MKKEPILVILAAGMGSRYGGLKQIDAMDDHGHIIMDFSLFDAYRAGFRRVVFIIKRDFVLQLLATIVGLFFIIDGIVKLRQEIFLFTKKNMYSFVLLGLAIALIIAGIALLVNPFNGTSHIIVFSGVCFIVSGLESIFLSMSKRKENKTRKG